MKPSTFAWRAVSKSTPANKKYSALLFNAPVLAVAVAFAMAMCALTMFAQSGAGSIQGTVTDATGGLIPSASVHVVNDATGVAADTKSNGVGFYQVPALFTGHYTVTVTAPGMKAYKSSIDLLVAQSAVINPVLVAGPVTQQVVVPGDTVQLTTTDNGTISSTLENARINQLPENGRDMGTLLTETTPGMENGGANINGLQPEAFEYTVDGTPTQADLHGGDLNTQRELLDPDAVQEVRIEANGGGAQYATPATSIVSTKSGTNGLHGTAFETARNNSLGIAKNRQDPPVYSAPHYVRNEFGASAGGPIVLPHIYHGKDKSFWFFAYERFSLADSAAVLTTTPTVAMSQGDFSGLISSKGILQTLYDPSTTKNATTCAATGKANAFCRTAFPNNQIPVTEEGPVAKLYYQLAPLPTSSADPLVTDNLTALAPLYEVFPQGTFRLDHEFNANNHAYLRYTQNAGVDINTKGAVNRAADGIPAGAAVGDKVYAQGPNRVFLGAVGYTHIFSPTFFAETVASQQWFNTKELPGAIALTPNVNYESMLGLPDNFGQSEFPAIGGGSLLFPLGPSVTNEEEEAQITSDLDENLTKIVGRNQMQFGGRFRHGREAMLANHVDDLESLTVDPTAVYQPTSGANYTALTNTGNDDASFFIGSANTYTNSLNPPRLHFHVMEFDAYFQDNYHVSRNLTVNLGLRYEAHPALWTKYGLMNVFDLKNHALVLAAPPATLIAEGVTTQALITNMENIGVVLETPAEFGVPDNSLLRNYNVNFLPRAGIAYQLFGGRHGTVIRGAYGRYIAPMPVNDFQDRAELNPPFGATYTMSYAAANQAIDDLPNELLRYNDPVQFGVMGVNTYNVVNTNSTNSLLPGSAFINASPNDPPTFITSTNFTIEQEVKGNSALRVSWIWNHATNLDDDDYYNQHPTTYQWEMATGTVPPTGNVIGSNQYSATATGPYNQITYGANQMYERNGWSNDNILQASYQRLFHHGIAYQIFYDFSKPMRFGGNYGSNATQNYVESRPYANYPGGLGTPVSTMIPAYGPVYAGVPPPAPPAGWPDWAEYHALDKYENYQLDSEEPIQDIRFNGIVDLPFGRGKRFFSNVNGFVNELIGGFQLAGDGDIVSQTFNPAAANLGPASPSHIYKHRYPITDCRSGVCVKSYLWWNGYLAPTVTQGVAGSVCTSNCVTGLPATYVPEQTPIDNDPTSAYYGDNDVEISAPGLGASPITATYDVGPFGGNYLQKSWLNGPINYTADISIFKVFPIKEGMNLRVNLDAFNALNVQGYEPPNTTDGTEPVQPGAGVANSYNTPRQIQLTARLTF